MEPPIESMRMHLHLSCVTTCDLQQGGSSALPSAVLLLRHHLLRLLRQQKSVATLQQAAMTPSKFDR